MCRFFCFRFLCCFSLDHGKQIVPSSWRNRISSFVLGNPGADPSAALNELYDDSAEKDARVLVDMKDAPSEAWESSGSVELTNFNWASANQPTPQVGAKTNDDHSDQDDRNRPAVDSTFNGPIDVGRGIAATLRGNVLFSPGLTQALEVQVVRLQASLDQAIQEKDQAIREKDRMIHQVTQEKDEVIQQVIQEKDQIIRDLKDQLIGPRD